MANTKKNTEEVIDLHNRVSPSELEEIIRTNIQTILDNPDKSSTIPPTMIWGPPGNGKSTIVKNIAEELGIEFIDFRLSQREPVDIKGMPVPDREKNVVNWIPSGDFPRDENAAGILLFDELSSAGRDLQAAAYEIILDRRIGKEYKLPKRFYIVGAGNRTQDRAVASTMSSALANRFMHLEIEANAEDWVKWGQYNDINPSILGFINYRPEYLFRMEGENLERGWPSPRSWERVSSILNIYGSGTSERIIRKLVYGLVGNHAGVEFMEFKKINAQFDNVLDYMLNPKLTLKIPELSSAKYALVSAMTYLIWKGKDEEDEKKRVDGFFRICMELSSDFASMAMMSAMSGSDKKLKTHYCDTLFKHPRYKEWAAKHGKALRKRIEI